MAPRANWKGYLKLSLVSCAVALYPASTSTTRVAFHTLSRETGHRLRRQMYDPDTGDVVDSEDQVKGYEVAKGEYVMVEDEEIDAIAIESTHTIDIETFVPREQIDELYLDAPYYIAPDDKVAEEAFAVIREAMREKDMVGLARVVLYRRERIIMLEPRGKGLFASILRYPYEVREDQPYFEDIPDVTVPPEMLDLAEHIIERMQGDFEPQAFEDRYENALIELVKAKQAGRQAALPQAPARPNNVVNLMDALRRSVQAEKQAEPPPAPAKSVTAKSAATARPASSKRGAGPSAAKPGNSPARGRKASAPKEPAPAKAATKAPAKIAVKSPAKNPAKAPANPAPGKSAATKSTSKPAGKPAAKPAPARAGGRLRKAG